MSYSEIHVWGDSLARGIIYNEARGRYAISHERCTSRLEAALDRKAVNHANMGATVEDGLAVFAKFEPIPDALCVIEFGGNDCDLDWAYVASHPDEPIQPKIALDRFKDGLKAFITSVRDGGMNAMLVTPLPLNAQRYFRWVTRGLDAEAVLKALGDVNHIYRWQERYAIAVSDVARSMGCPLFDLRDLFLSQSHVERLMCVDGIHPNDEGHRLIADAALLRAANDPNAPSVVARQEVENAHQTAIPSAGLFENVI